MVSWAHRNAWILRDLDGSLSGHVDGYIVPHGEQFAANPECHEMPGDKVPARLGAATRTQHFPQ